MKQSVVINSDERHIQALSSFAQAWQCATRSVSALMGFPLVSLFVSKGKHEREKRTHREGLDPSLIECVPTLGRTYRRLSRNEGPWSLDDLGALGRSVGVRAVDEGPLFWGDVQRRGEGDGGESDEEEEGGRDGHRVGYGAELGRGVGGKGLEMKELGLSRSFVQVVLTRALFSIKSGFDETWGLKTNRGTCCIRTFVLLPSLSVFL